MGTFIVRRLLWGLVTVFVVTVLVFGLFFAPWMGDPAARMAGKNPTEQQLEEIRKNFNLDKPLPVQYVTFIKQLVTADLVSYSQQVKVVPLVMQAMPKTMSLALFAAIIWLGAGLTLGAISALRAGQRIDRVIQIASLAAISIPVAWLALLGLMLFSAMIPIFPPGDYLTISEGGIFGWAYHLILPATMLALVHAGIYTQLSRQEIRSGLRADHVKTAVGKGLPWNRVFGHHILRISLLPLMVLFGLDFAALLGGAIFTESIFGLPGLGSILFLGISTLDIPIIMTSATITAVLMVISNLLVDLLQAALDPRIRLT